MYAIVNQLIMIIKRSSLSLYRKGFMLTIQVPMMSDSCWQISSECWSVWMGEVRGRGGAGWKRRNLTTTTMTVHRRQSWVEWAIDWKQCNIYKSDRGFPGSKWYNAIYVEVHNDVKHLSKGCSKIQVQIFYTGIIWLLDTRFEIIMENMTIAHKRNNAIVRWD